MANDSFFISTKNSEDQNQIGVISDFGGNHNYSVSVIDKVTDRYKYSGDYKAECNSYETYESFLSDYAHLLNENSYSDNYKAEDYIVDPESLSEGENSEFNTTIDIFAIQIVCFIILFIVLLYYLLQQAKTISIMKLHGYSSYRICYELFARQFTLVFLVAFVTIGILMSFVPDNTGLFASGVFWRSFGTYLALLVILSVVCIIYANRTSITYAIKGRKPTTAIVVFNGIFKIAASVATVAIATGLLANMNLGRYKKQSLSNWAFSSDYGVFYPIYVGKDKEAFRKGEDPDDIPMYELYSFLNKEMESIYMDSSIYTPDNLDANKNNDIIKTIKINPNYLLQFPVYDENSQRILINEQEEQTIYLVPEQYKDKEDYNREYFTEVRRQFHDVLHVDYYKQQPKEKSKELVFIYTRQGQNIFSMNMDVFPDNNNMIVDPIIQVMTEANSLVPDRFYGSSSNQPLFVKLADSDIELTYAKVVPILKKLGLDDNLTSLVKPNELALREINSLKVYIDSLSIALFGVIAILFIILFQSAYILFQRDKYDYFIKKAFGYPYLCRYSRIFAMIALTNLIEFVLCLIFVREAFYTPFLFKLMFEWLSLIGLIRYHERKNLIEMLKEGV